jgi:hypothetical protein
MRETFIWLAATLFWFGKLEAFHASIPGHKAAITPNQIRLYAEKETLKFVANIVASSSPLATVTKYDLNNFLKTTTCRDHFLSAGGTTNCIEEILTSELQQFWSDECFSHYGLDLLPGVGDTIVASESIVRFPGLKMVNTVYSGVKLVVAGDISPSYQIILVAEKKRVVGAPPVVWLFNQLTGHSSELEDIIRPPSARVQSSIFTTDTESGPCFTFDCRAEIIITFPKLLVKILPTTKEKMEEQGTASVKKTIEHDISKATKTVNEVFYEWSKLVIL